MNQNEACSVCGGKLDRAPGDPLIAILKCDRRNYGPDRQADIS